MEKTYYIVEHDQIVALETSDPDAFARVWFYCLETSLDTARHSNDGVYIVVKIYQVSEANFESLLTASGLAFESFTYEEIKAEMKTANWADETE